MVMMKHSSCQFDNFFSGFGQQSKKFSCIGTYIRCNFTPWYHREKLHVSHFWELRVKCLTDWPNLFSADPPIKSWTPSAYCLWTSCNHIELTIVVQSQELQRCLLHGYIYINYVIISLSLLVFAGHGQMYGRGGPVYGGPAPPYGQQPASTLSHQQTVSYGRGIS